MSKIIATVIVITLMLLSSLKGEKQPSPPQASGGDEMEVQVLFAGLMVLNEVSDGWQVGILPSQAQGHEFCIQRLGAPRVCAPTQRESASIKRKYGAARARIETNWLPTSTRQWRFELESATQPNERPVDNVAGDQARRPDTTAGQFDLDWVIRLDTADYHGAALYLAPNILNPIINMPKFKLFTKYKSPDLIRWQGQKSEEDKSKLSPFGFVADTVGFRVKLKVGEALTLKTVPVASKATKKTIPEEIITRIPYVAPSDIGGDYEVLYIYNTRYPQDEHPDFHMYYKLFPRVAVPEQYSFDRNPNNCTLTGPYGCSPINPSPDKKGEAKIGPIRPRCCCELVCSLIQLVNRNNQPLH